MDVKKFVSLFNRSFADFNQHNDTRRGAALAFCTVVSISPLVILVLAIVSLVFNKNAAEGFSRQSISGFRSSASRRCSPAF